MSAFQVSSAHVARLVAAAAALSVQYCKVWVHPEPSAVLFAERQRVLFDALAAENARSVAHRYDEDVEPVAFEAPRAVCIATIADIAAVVTLLDCYKYQSCEHPGWQGSHAERFCAALREALFLRVPGLAAACEDSPWTIDTQSMALVGTRCPA